MICSFLLQTVDEAFNKEERKFTNLDKAVRALVKDVSSYIEHVQVWNTRNVEMPIYILE